MKITISNYLKRCSVCRTIINKRIDEGKIKITYGKNERGNPCALIDDAKYPPEKQKPGKPGCPAKKKK